MSRMCWFLLFSVVVVHGTDGSACTGDLGFINVAYWPVLRGHLYSKVLNGRFTNIGIHYNRYVQAVVHTKNRQTYLQGLSNIYGTGNSNIRELWEIRGRSIKDMLFGEHFLAVLDYGGTVWTVGLNHYGQLSGGTRSRRTLARVSLPGSVKEIGVGYRHCVALTNNGQLFSWGYRHKGSLGYVSSRSTNPYPRRFTLGRGVSRPIKICCSAYACAVLTQSSGVYTWGEPADTGRRGDHRIPGRVLGIPWNQAIIKLSCGIDHTVAVSSSGRLYGWGRNTHGELLQTRRGVPHATLLAYGVNDAVAGRFLTIARLRSGNSMIFGRYNRSDYWRAHSTNHRSPRDLMSYSKFGSETKGAVRFCG